MSAANNPLNRRGFLRIAAQTAAVAACASALSLDEYGAALR